MPQLTFNTNPALGLPGQKAEGQPAVCVTAVAGEDVTVGNIVVRGPVPFPGTADSTGIIDTLATLGSATAQTFSGDDLDGAVGGGEMNPAANLILTVASDGNWDATTAVVTGVDQDDVLQTENFTIPNGGNAVVAGSKLFKKVISLFIPAQSGNASGSLGYQRARGQLMPTVPASALHPSAIAADVDAIRLSGTLVATSNTVISGTGLTGAVAGYNINPARNVTITQDASANWDATTAVVTGLDEEGRTQTEEFALEDGGDTVLTGSKLFSKVISIAIPAQSGAAAGSIGLGTKVGSLKALGLASLNQLDTENTTPHVIAEEDMVTVARKGVFHVKCLGASEAGKPVYVRIVAGGNGLGSIQSSSTGTFGAPEAAPLKGAVFLTSAASNEITLIHLDSVSE